MADARTNLAAAAAQQGKSLAELSRGAGKNHAYLQQFVTRGVPAKLPEDVRHYLATALRVPETDLGGPERGVSLSPLPARESPKGDVRESLPPSNAGPPAPVEFAGQRIGMFGQAVGGEDGRFVLNGQRVMDALCPPQLFHVPNAYGVFVHGDSMEPRYFSGEAVFVNPHMPVSRGDFAVVQIAGETEADDASGYVKRFVSMNIRELVLEQYKPRENVSADAPEAERFTLRFPRRLVIAVHLIVASGRA